MAKPPITRFSALNCSARFVKTANPANHWLQVNTLLWNEGHCKKRKKALARTDSTGKKKTLLIKFRFVLTRGSLVFPWKIITHRTLAIESHLCAPLKLQLGFALLPKRQEMINTKPQLKLDSSPTLNQQYWGSRKLWFGNSCLQRPFHINLSSVITSVKKLNSLPIQKYGYRTDYLAQIENAHMLFKKSMKPKHNTTLPKSFIYCQDGSFKSTGLKPYKYLNDLKRGMIFIYSCGNKFSGVKYT